MRMKKKNTLGYYRVAHVALAILLELLGGL
jgi:hypothetical protein